MCIGLIAFNCVFHKNNAEFKKGKSTDKLMGPSFDELDAKNKRALPAFKALDKEEIIISTYDGLKLPGYFYKCPKETADTVILVHGYNSSPYIDFPAAAPFYLENGYNVLCTNNRGGKCGDGNYTQFGTAERLDTVLWVQEIAKRYPKGNIYLHGLSLGGAIVCLMSELDMPNVRAIISDCAFASIRKEYAAACKTMINRVPEFALNMMYAWYKLTFGHSVDEFTPEKAVKNSKYPIMFVHGRDDRFIPYEQCETLYENCTSEKILFPVAGAGHAASFAIDRDGYTETALNWFKKFAK